LKTLNFQVFQNSLWHTVCSILIYSYTDNYPWSGGNSNIKAC
jgi:hypothetical protein